MGITFCKFHPTFVELFLDWAILDPLKLNLVTLLFSSASIMQFNRTKINLKKEPHVIPPLSIISKVILFSQGIGDPLSSGAGMFSHFIYLNKIISDLFYI